MIDCIKLIEGEVEDELNMHYWEYLLPHDIYIFLDVMFINWKYSNDFLVHTRTIPSSGWN